MSRLTCHALLRLVYVDFTTCERLWSALIIRNLKRLSYSSSLILFPEKSSLALRAS